MMETNARVLTVSQVNEYVKMLLDGDRVLGHVTVRGEISNFTNHYKTGHFYFTLKDEGSLLKAVMFRTAASRLAFLPETGMKVIVTGRVTAFVRDGQYQIYVDDMQPDGVGALYLAFEQLKAKLAAEGLFDPARKKPLPRFPRRIGIITSPTGAAVRDLIQILGRRMPMAQPVLWPALVQGRDAPASLRQGLRYFNATGSVDVIILGRGGGSMEDLWAFNDEGLARDVAASALPVISAVGHETDFTICDFAADLRAPTPSAAAELAVPDQRELLAALEETGRRCDTLLTQKVMRARQRLETLQNARALREPTQRLDDARMQVLALADRADRAERTRLDRATQSLQELARSVQALNPLAVLTRGYAVAERDGELLRSVRGLAVGDAVTLTLADGRVAARVTDIQTTKEADGK
jgi:exodeoxyribonuclease VII large subunit